MKTKILIIITGIFIFSVSGCGFLSKRYTKTESTEFRLSSAGKNKISLENINGEINIYKSTDLSEVVIKATKEVRVKKQEMDKPFDEIKINIDTISDVISVSTEIGRRSGFKLFNIGKDPKVEYNLYVPSGMEIEIENVNGDLSANNLNNNLKISVVNGDIDVNRFSGNLECEVTNGSFSGFIDSTGGVNVSLINGSVTMNLSSFMNANIKAETVNGKISDENLPLSEVRKEKKTFRGKLGEKETKVDINIETVNGRIKLLGRSEI